MKNGLQLIGNKKEHRYGPFEEYFEVETNGTSFHFYREALLRGGFTVGSLHLFLLACPIDAMTEEFQPS